jgi:multimeric flavodoxin WrbA
MPKKVLIINGSPKKNGNTSILISAFNKGAKSKGASVEVINAAFFKNKVNGCNGCRACQKTKEFACVIDDDASKVIKKMTKADVIVFATPLYFYGATAQLKVIIDRMFSLYHWDNETDEMDAVLAGKGMVLIASAYEDIGLKELEAPFRLTADYTGIKFRSLLIPNAGESGDLKGNKGILKKAEEFGRSYSVL